MFLMRLSRVCLIAGILWTAVLELLAAEPPRPLMREFVGINGHTVQFKPELYAPVCRLVRDYHPVQWDLGTNTSEAAPFPFAKNRVDWSKVYGSWRKHDWNIDASLMFESIKQKQWRDIEADARAYGGAFAREFGPSGSRKLVDSVEIGNEPGHWSDTDYTRLFRAMAEGFRGGDPKLKIATCNLTTGKSGKYEKSVECIAKFPQLYDVLNIHTYAQLENWPTWRRSFPEDPKLPKYLQDVESLCRWRDTNAPGKPIWITEFGYDSSTKSAEKTGNSAKWVGVTDEQQAQWLVRSLLVFSAMPVERAYIYFFNDNDKPSLHASAGITRNFQPKPSFHALAHLQRMLGDYRFRSVITNVTEGVRIQEYQHAGDARKLVWVAWSQTGEGKSDVVRFKELPGQVTDVQHMPSTANEATSARDAVAFLASGHHRIDVSESPLYVFLEKR
jgi:hypothetical protein